MQEKPMTQGKPTGTVLPVFVLFLIFAAILTACMLLFSMREEGSGMNPLIPMQAKETDHAASPLIDPGREVRGIWIPSVLNITYPSEQGKDAESLRAELDDIVRVARENRLNTICFQVRPSADALYDSAIFPTSRYLSGVQGQEPDAGFDPLAYLCEITRGADEDDAIAVYAWVNPLRVTSAGEDPALLAANNPAVLHPEWTFTYHNAVYFDAGIPAVRALVADGVREICEKYPVAGVIFDDYFYPYPTVGNDGRILPIDDADTYAAYGAAYETIGDFRRASANALVKDCYDAVKDVNAYLQFGIAPFGINKNDNGTNGGSATAGMEAYSAIYCDALAWMEGGYVDFIAPQIYWQFTTKVARYDTLVRWWNAQCDAYGIPLWISHAIYNYETWNNPGEMRSQVTFARAENMYRGSLFYGYPQLKNNTLGLAEEIKDVFRDEIVYYKTESDPAQAPEIHITMPKNGSRFDAEGTYLMGQSDPHTTLYCDGIPVSRTKTGYFVLYKALGSGENTFVFTQGDTTLDFTVWRGQNPPVRDVPDTTETETETAAPVLSAVLQAPTALTAAAAEEGIWVSVSATKGAVVSAVLGDTTQVLTEGTADDAGMARYEGRLSLPECEIGEVRYTDALCVRVEKDGFAEPLVLSGPSVYALGAGAAIPVLVTEDSTHLKIAPDSWYYDDYLPQSAGMTVTASSIRDGYAHVRLGGNTAYLAVDGITVTDAVPAMTTLGAPGVGVEGTETVITLPANGAPPVNCVKNGETFTVKVYRAATDAETGVTQTLPENPLFRDCTIGAGGEEEGAYVTYTFTLHARDRFYGFRVVYADGVLQVLCRNPVSVDTAAAQPLHGKTIILDAGHGGVDTGTLTPGSHLALNEADCNLAIVSAAAEMLRAHGAEVILLREEDTTVDIYRRMEEVDRIAPDLLLSIHQNAMPQNTDVSHIRGVVGLYWTESGRSLADCVAEALSVSLGRLKRDTVSQRLAMLRNYKFPSALIEIGFVTCPEEFEVLTARDGVEKAARALCDGILAWYDTQSLT